LKLLKNKANNEPLEYFAKLNGLNLKRSRKMTSKIDCVFLFGKYKGKLVSEVYEENSEYLEWLLENCDLHGDLLKAVEYHLGVD